MFALPEDRNGCVQSRQRFLLQLRDVSVMCQSVSFQDGRVKHVETTQIFRNLTKVTHRQTTMGGSRGKHHHLQRGAG